MAISAAITGQKIWEPIPDHHSQVVDAPGMTGSMTTNRRSKRLKAFQGVLVCWDFVGSHGWE